MNEVFVFNRWLLLVAKHWSENRKKYLLGLVAITGLMVIWLSFILLIERHNPYTEEVQLSTYLVGMAVIGCLYGSLLFAELAGGPKAIHFLSVPASALEKLLCALFFGVLLFFICYTVIFHLVDYTMVNVANNFLESYWADRDPGHKFVAQKVVNVFSGPEPENPEIPNYYFYLLLTYFHVQAAFTLGSIYFANYSYVKTAISVLLVFLFFVFFVGKVLAGLLPDGGYYGGNFTAYFVHSDNGSRYSGVKLPDWVGSTVEFLFKYAFAPLFWVVTYFRLKEKEV